MSDVQPGWYPDPTHRFEVRFHNGAAWTADVSSNGERYVDPLGTQPGAGPTATRTNGSQNNAPGPRRNSKATASLVLGIVAVGIGWMPVIVAAGMIATVLALVFGFSGRRTARQSGVGEGFATAGLILGVLGILASVGGVFFTVSMVRAVDRYENPPANTTTITSCDRQGNEMIAVGELTNSSDDVGDFNVRVSFVRTGTDNARRRALVTLRRVEPGETRTFEVSRSVNGDDTDCIIGDVHGALPFGVDPGP